MKLAAAALLLLAVTAMIAVAVFRSSKPAVTENPANSAIRYLPLGDSYTIGEGVAKNQRWPDQLVARLRQDKVDIAIVANPAVTGFTTQNLIDRELPLLQTHKPNFVTIQIGVNDYVQGVPQATFTQNLRYILDEAQKTVPQKRIVLVTIPDYGKTPAGARYGDPEQSALAIKRFNDSIIAEAAARGLLAVDMYPISQMVADDSSLTAPDGLHPSGKQYGLWSDAIYKAIKQQELL